MPRKKIIEQYERPREKSHWHTFGLQSLPPARFASVTAKILQGRYVLITSHQTNGKAVL